VPLNCPHSTYGVSFVCFLSGDSLFIGETARDFYETIFFPSSNTVPKQIDCDWVRLGLLRSRLTLKSSEFLTDMMSIFDWFINISFMEQRYEKKLKNRHFHFFLLIYRLSHI